MVFRVITRPFYPQHVLFPRHKIYVRVDLFSKAKMPQSLFIDDLTTTTNRIYYGWYAKTYSFQGSFLRKIIPFFLLFFNSYDSSSFSNIFSRHFSIGFYVLLTVHPNIMIVLFFFTNFMHRFFILIHLLHSSTRFEQYCAHLQENNYINTASGIVTLFGWLFSTQVTVYWTVTQRVTIPDAVLIQLCSWRWAQ